VFNFSSTVSDNFQSRFNEFLGVAVTEVSASLDREALDKGKTVPWASERAGNTIHVVFPLTLRRGDLLGEILTILCSKIPTCVVHEGNVGWVEPEWSAEAQRRLLGIAAALQGAPLSFATTSSPIDLTRSAVWQEAAAVALSKPGGVRDARASVLPNNVAGKSASKYMSTVFSSLRSCINSEDTLAAVHTLQALIKLWCREQAKEALALVRRQRISWGEVLKKGAPTEIKKVRGVDNTNVVTPIKPSRSPWISGAERTQLSSLFSSIWSKPDEIRKRWIGLTPSEQHLQFSSYVNEVRSAYADMSSVASSTHAKLGHRKRWIVAQVEELGKDPKNKKEKKNQFTWSTIFFKSDLRGARESVKKVFCPAHYLGNLGKADECLGFMYGLYNNAKYIDWRQVEIEFDKPIVDLFKEWYKRFAPNLELIVTIPEATNLEDDNRFAAISERESADQ